LQKRLTSDDHLDGEDAISSSGGGGDPVGDAAALVSDLGVQEGPLATGRLLFTRHNSFSTSEMCYSSAFKGIDRPFGEGVKNRLIQSLLINWRLGNFFSFSF
jgi:hypothetical protein